MNRRRIATVVASALRATGTFLAAAPPAAAGTLPTAHASIGVGYPTTTTFHVCAGGVADNGIGEWLFEIDGLRSDGTQIHYEQGGFGASFDNCVSPNISTNGTPDGNFDATLYYARIGSPVDATSGQTTDVPELVAVAGTEVDWTPQQNSNGFGM